MEGKTSELVSLTHSFDQIQSKHSQQKFNGCYSFNIPL